MGKKIGIDLGTTYSCVATVDENGVVKILDNSEGQQTTPSVVFIADGQAIVGATARDEGGLRPECIVERSKNYMGDPDHVFNLDGTDYSSAAIAKLILTKLFNDAKTALEGEEIDGVIVTCPAYFKDAERNATRTAALEAGLPLIQLLDEPVAAALAYGYSRHEDMDKQVLIYDLGGGTFDVTIMKIKFSGDERKMEVITTGGDHKLGGKDWDEILTNYFIEEFCNRTGCDPQAMKTDPEIIQYFSANTEKAKKILTTKDSTSLVVSYEGQKEKIEVTREKFDELTESQLNQTISLIEQMFDDKGMTIDQIDEIILVGGSTRMPQVKERLDREYGKPITIYEPDKAVAMGAALMASFDVTEKADPTDSSNTLGGGTNKPMGNTLIAPDGTKTEVVIKTTHSYGLISLDANRQRVLSNIIMKDTVKPCDVSRSFACSVNDQVSVLIEILENDSLEKDIPESEGTKIYEDSTIDLGGPQAEGTPLEITFAMSADGTLEVLLSVNGGPRISVTPKRIGDEANRAGMDQNIVVQA